MKVLWSWLGDPCVHILMVGLVLIRLALSAGPDPEDQVNADRPTRCRICKQSHERFMACPTLAARPVAFAASE